MKRDYWDEEEQINRLLVQQRFRCAHCKKRINKPNLQRAHIVPKTKKNIERYGNYIHGDHNIALVCSGYCNDSVLLGCVQREDIDRYMEEAEWQKET